jgi:hypothetical protein
MRNDFPKNMRRLKSFDAKQHKFNVWGNGRNIEAEKWGQANQTEQRLTGGRRGDDKRREGKMRLELAGRLTIHG